MRRPPNRSLVLLAAAMLVAALGSALSRTPAGVPAPTLVARLFGGF